MKLILLLATLSIVSATSARAEPTEYDDLVARFGSSGENIQIDKLTHAHWIIDFPERCVLRRRTTTYVSLDGQLGLVDDTVESAEIGAFTEESFIWGEGASKTQIIAACSGKSSCVSGVRAGTGREGNFVVGSPTVRTTLADHVILKLSSVANKHRLELMRQVAALCRSDLEERQ